MSIIFEQLQPYLDKAYAYRTALTMLSWDNSTAAPKDAAEFTAKAIGILSREKYHTIINEEVKGLLAELSTQEEPANFFVYAIISFNTGTNKR